ncbi:MAG: phosphatidylserine decarboxylase family protein [Zetaproteobacteria bacterium CG_4_9_14_3_um_filter_53_7]|nr:MAG: phosphatidylserine decarboxylase family protein [Zetaproteobacteria bacterium CG_4_9_14_3_um_filter_53_7]
MTKQLPVSGQPRGTIPFAPEAWRFVIPTTVAMLIAWFFGWAYVATPLFILLVFMLNFFRDPEREVPQGDNLFICPADGKVIRAEKTEAGHQRVDIFMNVFNVHVNRAPMSGRITHMHYFPGKFVNASFDHASEENERNRFEMECDNGAKIAFTQISGLVARRIVSYVEVGDKVKAGERIGMIRFGSRVNCEIPDDYQLNVKVGEMVTAGSTVIAVKKSESEEV